MEKNISDIILNRSYTDTLFSMQLEKRIYLIRSSHFIL